MSSEKDKEMKSVLSTDQFKKYLELKEQFKDELKEKLKEKKNGNTEIQSDNNSEEISFTTTDGRKRQYTLYIPQSIDNKNNSVSLVIVLHGTYGTGRKMQKGLGFDKYAEQYGFMVAYPDAYTEPGKRQTSRWNDGRNTLESSKIGINDVSFILEMIEHINAKKPIDRKRIYVTGASNGGIMTYRLGCEAAGTFAAIAPVIGNIADNQNSDNSSYYNHCYPDTPISLLAINGDADPFIPFNGGEVCKGISKNFCEGGYVVSVEKSLQKFIKANGCSGQYVSEFLPEIKNDGTKVEKRVYYCSDKIEIISYIIHNGGHTWPPNTPQLGDKSGITSQNIDATKVIVEFFMNHTKAK